MNDAILGIILAMLLIVAMLLYITVVILLIAKAVQELREFRHRQSFIKYYQRRMRDE